MLSEPATQHLDYPPNGQLVFNGGAERVAAVETFVPRLLSNLIGIFSDDETADEKTIREVACEICRTVLAGLNDRFPRHQISICALFGFFEWLNTLKLKGAAGFQPHDVHKKQFKVGEGIIGHVAEQQEGIITKDLKNDPRTGGQVEAALAQSAGQVALLAYPLLLKNKRLVGVFVLGQFNSGLPIDSLFEQAAFKEIIDLLVKHVATVYHQAILVAKGQLRKKYDENAERVTETARQFYRRAAGAVALKEFMERIAEQALHLLNAGNPGAPFYTNYLFYEYQEYRERFVLSFFYRNPKPRYLRRSFSLTHPLFKEYIADGFVKSIESQKRFVQNRGREPYVVRYIPNKVEAIIEKPDANWSPAGSGVALIVPLFEDKHPLGILVFLGKHQQRRYVDHPIFYLGAEKRKSSLYDLKYFRNLQPIIAREYFNLKLEDKQRLIAKLENILSALKEIILIENRHEVLDRLAEFTAKSLDCEGCLIYLVNAANSQLHVAAAFGFQDQAGLKEQVALPLQPSPAQRKSLPAQLLEQKKEIMANSDLEFERIAGKSEALHPFFKQLKSGKVISYLGRSIGKLGVIEVFNKAKLTPSGWSFFEEQDTITLRHIGEAIATVLNRMEATASQVKNEKVKLTSELLLDISHELKNPLYASLIHVRQLKTVLKGHPEPAAENGAMKTLSVIERNVEKAQRILSSMQNFQASETQMKREPVHLEKILRLVLQTNELLCEQQRITVGTAFSAEAPLVYGDELQLNQIFTNLVKNAMDAMPAGGMLQVRLYEVEGSLQVEIADTGSGIPDDVKDRIFEPFVTTKNSEQGTGLGLALSQRLIKQHQGKIEFESEWGWGTKFLVTLPKFVEPVLLPAKPFGASNYAFITSDEHGFKKFKNSGD